MSKFQVLVFKCPVIFVFKFFPCDFLVIAFRFQTNQPHNTALSFSSSGDSNTSLAKCISQGAYISFIFSLLLHYKFWTFGFGISGFWSLVVVFKNMLQILGLQVSDLYIRAIKNSTLKLIFLN